MWKINLVLSGGGARGIAHLGVIKALQESGFTIDAISGVSSGAIVGAFIAKGVSPDEILDIALSTKGFNLKRPPFSLGLFKKKNMLEVLNKHFANMTFNDLKIPLYISATNINTCNTDFFNSGELVMPLVASSAIPLLFSPVHLNGYQYMDGGLVNNLPVEPFLDSALPRVGVSVNYLNGGEELSSTLSVITRAIQISISKSIEQRKKFLDLVIEPQKLCEYAFYDFSKPKEIFDAGYDCAKRSIEDYVIQNTKKRKRFWRKFAA
jgi:NTE family protein